MGTWARVKISRLLTDRRTHTHTHRAERQHPPTPCNTSAHLGHSTSILASSQRGLLAKFALSLTLFSFLKKNLFNFSLQNCEAIRASPMDQPSDEDNSSQKSSETLLDPPQENVKAIGVLTSGGDAQGR